MSNNTFLFQAIVCNEIEQQAMRLTLTTVEREKCHKLSL